MKTLILIFCTFMCALTVNGQNLFIDTVKQNSINDSAGLDYFSVMLGLKNIQDGNFQKFEPSENANREYFDETNVAPSLQKFRLDTITSTAFLKHKKSYSATLDTSSSRVKWTDTSFVIKTENWQQSYETRSSEEFSNSYYLGYLLPLNLYVVHGIDGHNEIGWMELTDKKTGKTYIFQSPSDYPFEIVNVSPKQEYLLGYLNDLYDGTAFISILKINKSKNSYTLSDFYGINMGNTLIKELVWINENSFAIKAVKEYTSEENTLSFYLKISFSN